MVKTIVWHNLSQILKITGHSLALIKKFIALFHSTDESFLSSEEYVGYNGEDNLSLMLGKSDASNAASGEASYSLELVSKSQQSK